MRTVAQVETNAHNDPQQPATAKLVRPSRVIERHPNDNDGVADPPAIELRSELSDGVYPATAA
jgi:hypothetical protein